MDWKGNIACMITCVCIQKLRKFNEFEEIWGFLCLHDNADQGIANQSKSIIKKLIDKSIKSILLDNNQLISSNNQLKLIITKHWGMCINFIDFNLGIIHERLKDPKRNLDKSREISLSKNDWEKCRQIEKASVSWHYHYSLRSQGIASCGIASYQILIVLL